MEMHNRNQSDLLPYEKLAILDIDRKKGGQLTHGSEGEADGR